MFDYKPVLQIRTQIVSVFVFCCRRKCEMREAEVLEPKDLTSRVMFPASQIKMR